MRENAANYNPQKRGESLSDSRLTLCSNKFAGNALVVLVVVGAILVACLPSGSLSSAQNEEKVQLVYQDWRTDWFPPMAQQLLAEFHATHPNIHVFYTPDPENLEEKMLADMQAGAA
jgi:ABC-type glycerol-3-phosphate transport system substrate-binding protein